MNSHELNSTMLFIHPPLAIAGYVFIFLFTLDLFLLKSKENRRLRLFGLSAWLLSFLGLITGMFWAQLAWGSYWSWDPKETMTLIFFLSVTMGQAAYYEKSFKLARWSSLLSCVLSILTLLISFIIEGLHSFI